MSPRNPSWRRWAGRAAVEDRLAAGQPRRPVTERASGAAAGSSLLPFYCGRGPALSKDRCPSSDSPRTEGAGVRGGAASRGHVPQGRRACPGTRTLPTATRLCQHVALVKVPLSDRRLVPRVQIDTDATTSWLLQRPGRPSADLERSGPKRHWQTDEARSPSLRWPAWARHSRQACVMDARLTEPPPETNPSPLGTDR